MTERTGPAISKNTLSMHGVQNAGHEYWNLSKAALYQMAVARSEGVVAKGGPLITRTGSHTGRAAKDKVFVREPSSEDKIDWGDVNKPVEPAVFDKLKNKLLAYYQGRDLFVMDVYAGADEKFRLPVRVVTENAWHAMFVDTMFIRAEEKDLADFKPEFTILHAPNLLADPEVDGVRSSTAICVNFGANETVIMGTRYAGEIKKSAFGAMNYYLPQRGVLTMHASANIGLQGRTEGKSAVFFGLSGTGKTTLSADQSRALIGDDEHGWSDEGVFNIEGGCYAKVIRLDPKTEPEIFATTRRFGTVLENVVYDENARTLDLDDATFAENTRAAYDIEAVPNYQPGSKGGHPSDVVMLTADAFGVLPPISRLTKEQAMYWFLLGYTAKVAGTEMGVTEPQATFSACFGAPFMPLPPTTYAKMLGEKIDKHGVRVWLLNTGWTGGAYGTGKRMSLPYTRAMLNAALNGDLDDVKTRTDEIFGLHIPVSCPNVPDDVLDPKKTWNDDAAYDKQAKVLAAKFVENFKPYHDKVEAAVKAVSPKL